MCVCVCVDDKGHIVTHWQILQIEQGEKEEKKEGVEIRSADTDYHHRAQ